MLYEYVRDILEGMVPPELKIQRVIVEALVELGWFVLDVPVVVRNYTTYSIPN